MWCINYPLSSSQCIGLSLPSLPQGGVSHWSVPGWLPHFQTLGKCCKSYVKSYFFLSPVPHFVVTLTKLPTWLSVCNVFSSSEWMLEKGEWEEWNEWRKWRDIWLRQPLFHIQPHQTGTTCSQIYVQTYL